MLPLANLSGDAGQDYFADGITEDITLALSRWRSFQTIARNSAFLYKGRVVDVKQVGRDLGVRYVLEGSVRKVGNRLRITVQLIDTTTAAHVWAERYDRELTDIFEVQDDICRRIAAVIEPELARHVQRQAMDKTVDHLAAWDLLHRGLFHLYKFTKADIAAARSYFERAIALDPHFCRAYTSLAYTHQLDVLHGYADDIEHSIGEHLRHARKGVELDDGDSYAHLMLAFAYVRTGDHDLTLAEARKAADVNPHDAWAHAMVGRALDAAGESAAGLPYIERSIALTPRDPHVKFYLAVGAQMLINKRDYREAERWARRSIEADPSQARPHLLLAIALRYQERWPEARAALAACEAATPGFPDRWHAWREYRDEADRVHMSEGFASLRRAPKANAARKRL